MKARRMLVKGIGLSRADRPAFRAVGKPAVQQRQDRSPARQVANRIWETRLRALLEFKQTYGHCNVPRGWPEDPSLSYWVINQRYQLREGRLAQDRVRRLQESGISWTSASERRNSRVQAWTRMYRKLAEFKSKYGHCDVKAGRTPDLPLARWLLNQRYLMRKGGLREDRRQRLDELGIRWYLERGRSPTRDQTWERMYSALKKFKEEHGHCEATSGRTNHPELARWVTYQRRLLARKTLPEDRRRRLQELGLQGGLERGRSRIRERAWTQMYASLEAFKRERGHCRVPRPWPEHPCLARWVSQQRYLKRYGRLLREREGLLEKIGFEWGGVRQPSAKSDQQWERMFGKLLGYKAAQGHTRVPRHSKDHQELADWVMGQRRLRRIGRLGPERIARLADAGLDWDGRQSRQAVRDNIWDSMFERLQRFKALHGHWKVRDVVPLDSKLSGWISQQRFHWKSGTLRKDRIQRLEAISFEWKGPAPHRDRKQAWMKMFQLLARNKQLHGSCSTPGKDPEHVSLRSWIARQRLGRRKGTLSSERIRWLDDLGFDWHPPRLPTALPGEGSHENSSLDPEAVVGLHGNPHAP
jgi:hypothetical protein